MRKEAEAVAKLRNERLIDWPELTTPANQFLLAVGGGSMDLFVKVVSIFATIVIKLRWKRR